jgi:hypothetical protein
MTFSITTDIDATPERVRAVMSDVERWHEWTSTVTRIELLDRPLAVGSRMMIRQPKLPPALWKVTSIDATGLTSVTRGPGVTVTAHHWVEPTAAGSRATLSIDFSGLVGPMIGWLTRGLNDRYLAIEAAGLKRRSESSAREATP